MKRLLLCFLLLVLPSIALANSVTVVNAASYSPFLAPDSIAAGFILGADLVSDEFVVAVGLDPYEVGGVRVYLAGSPCKLFYVGPKQVNFHVPPGTPLGLAPVAIYNRAGLVYTGSVFINSDAPNLFTFGDVEAAAVYLRLGEANLVYAVLFGTGISCRVNAPIASPYNPAAPVITNGYVALVADGKEYPATYAGPAAIFIGEQQINVPLPADEFLAPRFVYLRVCDLAKASCWSSNVVKIVVR